MYKWSRFLLVCCVFMLIFVLGEIAYYTSLSKKRTTSNIKPVPTTHITQTSIQRKEAAPLSGSYPFNTAAFELGYKIENVTVYLTDLEYKFTILFQNTIENRGDKAKWKQVADTVTKDAIIQNEGIKLKLFTRPAQGKLNPELINKARDYLKTKGTSYISGEHITVWFNNIPTPTEGYSMSVEARKKLAQEYIQILYNKLNTNPNYTLKIAGNEIASNTKLQKVDVSYTTNAYRMFEFSKPKEEVFIDPEMNKALYALGEGEMSKVLTGRDFNGKNWYDAYFIIMKVNTKKTTEFNSIDELVKARIMQGLIVKI